MQVGMWLSLDLPILNHVVWLDLSYFMSWESSLWRKIWCNIWQSHVRTGVVLVFQLCYTILILVWRVAKIDHMGMIMVLHWKGWVWYRQCMNIKRKLTLNISTVLISRFLRPIYRGSMYLTQGTRIAILSINYLSHFAWTEIDSCDHVHLHLHYNNRYYVAP